MEYRALVYSTFAAEECVWQSDAVQILFSKPIQSEAVCELLCDKEVLVTMPTGYGKSFIYHVLPFCASSNSESQSFSRRCSLENDYCLSYLTSWSNVQRLNDVS